MGPGDVPRQSRIENGIAVTVGAVLAEATGRLVVSAVRPVLFISANAQLVLEGRQLYPQLWTSRYPKLLTVPRSEREHTMLNIATRVHAEIKAQGESLGRPKSDWSMFYHQFVKLVASPQQLFVSGLSQHVLHRSQHSRVQPLRRRHEAKVGAHLSAGRQVDILSVNVCDFAACLLKQQHRTSVVPSFGISIPPFVHPHRRVAEAHGQRCPTQDPGQQVTARICGIETLGDGLVHAVEG